MSTFLHCWQADLTTDYSGWPAAEALLSGAEQARQARLRTPALRQTYGRTHGFLRNVLTTYNHFTTGDLTFTTDANGKPQLAAGGLHFNLSYRLDRALLAVSNAGPVGVDVEPLAPLADAAALVAELFAPAEQAALRAAAPADYWPLFYLIWTRKEAYAKALGVGLGMPFAAFLVLKFQPGAPPALTAPAGCCLRSFAVGKGYQGALATLSTTVEPAVQYFTYPVDLHNLTH